MRFTKIPAAVLLCGVALTSACSKRETAQGATRDAPAAGVTVSDIDIGRGLNADFTVRDKTDDFKRTDTIYASVKTAGTGTGTIRARWTYQDGQVVNESSQNIATSPDARTEFHIVKPDGWPVGEYRVEISVNGAVAGTKEFEVK